MGQGAKAGPTYRSGLLSNRQELTDEEGGPIAPLYADEESVWRRALVALAGERAVRGLWSG